MFINDIRSSSLFKSASVYTFTNILNALVPFLLLPVITRYLSAEDYGIVAMFTMLTSMATVFIGLSVKGAIARQYYEKNSIDIAVYIGNCFYVLFVTTGLVSVLFLLFLDVISNYTFIPNAWLWSVIFFSFAQFIVSVLLVLLQVQVKPVKYGLIQIFQTASNFVLSIIFVVYIGMKWEGRILAQLLSVFIIAVISIVILLRNNCVIFKFKKDYMKNVINFGLPLIPHAFGGLLMTMIGRIMITNMIDISETGLYTVGLQIGSIISMLAVSFNSAYVPWLFKNLKEGKYESKIKVVKVTYLYFILIILLALSLSVVSPWFLRFFIGKDFIASTKFILWAALGYAFQGMYYMVTNYIFYSQKTYLISIITFVVSLLNIIFTYFFIILNGSIGAAQSMALTSLIYFIVTWKTASKVHDMPWLLSTCDR